ncbi:FAD-dependent monooxygenase [Sorangium sp. So ce726]|uniref:FAD-dependent monooxygenase n=1 Tax=Sorangium sp. So ce726 TaxID=3133319 RepID=UPI003F5E5245
MPIAARALVIGGGIGGLAAALALVRRGVAVDLVEKAASFEPVGAGIILSANAVACLRALEADPVGQGRILEEMWLRDRRGRPLQRLAVGELAERCGPSVTLRRAALHALLLDALGGRATLRLGTTVASLDPTEAAVSVVLSDGARERYDIVVGADGLRSATRARLTARDPIRYSGTTCWRGLCPNPGVEEVCEYWGHGARVGLVPLPEGQIYIYLVRNAPRGTKGSSGGAAEVVSRFADFGHDAPRALSALSSAPLVQHDLEDLDAPTWGEGRVFLLGDAAHAALPNQGQGAAMAIEDALALRDALGEPTVARAREAYVGVRHARVAALMRDARRIGRAAHWEHPLACALRDGLLRATPRAIGSAQLRALVEPGVRLAAQRDLPAPAS